MGRQSRAGGSGWRNDCHNSDFAHHHRSPPITLQFPNEAPAVLWGPDESSALPVELVAATMALQCSTR